ncbi:MAG: CofH family radical SAM protein, partial [Planctomycetota bacterium]|nr:CofH family radical SAM protein [Planctomycetota bacterium]
MSSTTALEDAVRRIGEGRRLDDAGALALLAEAPLADLARLATLVRRRLHPSDIATWCADRNINYTDICESRCAFCAYWRPAGDPGAFVLDREDIFSRVEELAALGGTQILLQGGHNPDIPFDWYLDLLRGIKARFRVHIHAFSPPEIWFFSRRFRMPVRRVLEELKAAGLDSLPGGGAEILVDRVRKQISPAKIGADDWLGVMRCAHEVGLKGSATMVFGHVETMEERIGHLRRIRDLQDETGGLDRGVFTAFIPWPMQPRNTALEGKIRRATASEYLRTVSYTHL